MSAAERTEGGPRVLAMPGRPEWDDLAARELLARLSSPFPADEVAWVPAAVRGDRAFVAPAVQPRAVMDRLDDVMGPAGWRDEYEERAGGLAYCRLTLAFPGLPEVTKADAAPVPRDPCRRSPYGDALAAAAAKFGVGRYLDRVPREWVPFDEAKGRPLETPSLPSWALPEPSPGEVPPDEPDAPRGADAAAETAPEPEPEPEPPKADDRPQGLWAWVIAAETKAAAERRASPGGFSAYLESSPHPTLRKYGHPRTWPEHLRPKVIDMHAEWHDGLQVLIDHRQADALDREMSRTGKLWDRLADALGLVTSEGYALPPSEMTSGQWHWAMHLLMKAPDARR